MNGHLFLAGIVVIGALGIPMALAVMFPMFPPAKPPKKPGTGD